MLWRELSALFIPTLVTGHELRGVAGLEIHACYFIRDRSLFGKLQ